METLTPDSMSIATIGDEPRNFASLQRAAQRLLSKTPVLHGNITAQDIIDTIHDVRREPRNIDRSISTTDGTHDFAARPVIGPTGQVHGVRFWLGPAGSTPPLRPAFGSLWDLGSQTIRHTVKPPPNIARPCLPLISLAELFHRAIAFDRHDEVLDFLYHPEPGAKIQFDATLTHRPGRNCRWRNTIRFPKQPTEQAHWLAEFVTAASDQLSRPTLEQLGLRDAMRRAHIHLAVIQVAYSSITYWLTDPAPWIRWDELPRPAEVFHPDDRHLLSGAADLLPSGANPTITLRTLGHSGAYSPTRCQLFPCPGRMSGQFVIGQLTKLGDSSNSHEHASEFPVAATS